MTSEILTVLGILGIAVLLFISERLRVDLVALIVLVALAVTGLVTPQEALSGFSNLAVITVWAVLILSGALARTGVARMLGRRLLLLAGEGEARLVALLMLTVGILSGFMNDIGIAALMLPVTIEIARRTGRAPSKLLMPLAFASLLGGLNTLIGTPPNILISEALRDADLTPFAMFDYTPVGLAVMIAGVGFMALIGRRLLPSRDIGRVTTAAEADNLHETYELQDRLFILQLPSGSPLAGKSVAECRLGSALGVNLIGVFRDSDTKLAPEASYLLHEGDRLLVTGRQDRFQELKGRRQLVLESGTLDVEQLVSSEIEVAQISLGERSPFVGSTLGESDFRRKFGLNVLAVWRDGEARRTNLRDYRLRIGDVLLVQGPHELIQRLRSYPAISISDVQKSEIYQLQERLLAVRIPEESTLAGKTLEESRIGAAFGLTVLGIVRGTQTVLMPGRNEQLEAGDTLLVEGKSEDLTTLQGLEQLEIESQDGLDLARLQTEEVGLSEVVLSPHTTLAGKTLRQIRFREKYGLSVVAIWRSGRALRSNLGNRAMQFGDALLLYGLRHNVGILATDPDFLVLTEAPEEPSRYGKALVAGLIMVAVLLPVVLGWLPIAIAAVMGVVLMILSGAISMDEAYRSIEWKAIFLIAGMLPLGIAMERTGAARYLAQGMVDMVGGYGPLAVLAGLFVLAALASQVMPNPAVAVLLAPIALNAAVDLDVSPYPLMMAVAISASAAFLSPVGHSANVLIMGPGGYRFTDYIKVGIPLTLVVLIVVLLLLPIVWPF